MLDEVACAAVVAGRVGHQLVEVEGGQVPHVVGQRHPGHHLKRIIQIIASSYAIFSLQQRCALELHK